MKKIPLVEIERVVAQDVESTMAFIMNEASKKFKLDTAALLESFKLQLSSKSTTDWLYFPSFDF